jgi:uracil-DNA glycosylase
MQSAFDFGQGHGHAQSHAQSHAAKTLTAWPPDVHSLADDWQAHWQDFAVSQVGHSLVSRIGERVALGARIYPPEPLRIFSRLALSAVQVVILGQDPYHGPGQAEGLAFSVPEGSKIPPSLRNIFKEIQRESQSLSPTQLAPLPVGGHLQRWVQQGVLLLNTALTVEEGLPASHARWGWEDWTDRVITAVARRHQPVVFMLWGAHAQAKQKLIHAAEAYGGVGARHLILQANHPSPLSAMRPPSPFIGCGHFSAANAFLQKNGQPPIDW